MRPENVRTGMKLGPIFYLVSAEQVGRFTTALRSSNPLCANGAEQVAPPTMRLQDYALLIAGSFYGGDGGVHAKHRNQFLQPLRVGQTAKVTGSIVNTEWKRGKFYFELEYETRDAETDELLVRQAITSYLIQGKRT